MVVYGAFIGAALAFLVFCVRNQLSPLAISDLIAPSLLAGLACGRIGCLLNGCCYGGESDQPWAVTFPRDSMPYLEQVTRGRLFGFALAETSDENPRPAIAKIDADLQASSELKVGMKIAKINGQAVSGTASAQQLLFEAFSAGSSLQLETEGGIKAAAPAAVAAPRSRPVHPTQIYSAVHAGALVVGTLVVLPTTAQRWRGDGADVDRLSGRTVPT